MEEIFGGVLEVDARFRGFLEAAPDAIVIADRAGHIVLVNSQTEHLFGYARTELVGKKVEILVPLRFRDGHPGHRAAYLGDPKVRGMGADLDPHGLRKNGTEFPIEISLSPLETEDGTFTSSTIRDVTERKRADELRFRLAAIVDSSEDAIIGYTLAGIITSWNHGAERIFGYSAEETIGQPISLLLPVGHVDEPGFVDRLVRSERIESFETQRRRRNGCVIEVSVTISPVWDGHGGLIGASKMARDISDRKRVEAALAAAKDAAEQASREFEAFSYSVAHDLRSPLRRIDRFSQALLEDHADRMEPKAKHYVQKVRESAYRMTQLIDALLALARISQSDIRRERVDLSALARETLSRLQSEQPGRVVDLCVADDLSCVGDGRLIEIAFTNLFSNAWKFTAQRPDPRIEFGSTHDGERAFFITDNGVGFDMRFVEKLFGVFQRLHSERDFDGIGIGLATVQRVVKRHGGRIWANAELERGATFYFTLGDNAARAA